jgi:signal transduction histidine kinase
MLAFMRKLPLILLLALTPFSITQAQIDVSTAPDATPRDYNFTQYNSENGLPQNSVNDLLLDKNDFLWIATHNGLVRFDGHQFRVYNTANTPILQSNRFPLLSETIDRRVLVKSSFDDSVIYYVTPTYDIAKEETFTRLQKKLISYHSNGVFDYGKLLANFSTGDTAQTAFLYQLYRSGYFWVFNDHEIVINYLDNFYYVNSREIRIRKLPRKFDAGGSPKGFVINDVFCIAEAGGRFSFFKQGKSLDIAPDTCVARLFEGYEKMNAVQFFLHVKGRSTILRRHNDYYSLKIEGARLSATALFKELNFLENQPIYSVEFDSLSKILFLGSQNNGLIVVKPRWFHTLGFSSIDYSNNSFMALELLPNHRILTNNGILEPQRTGQNRLFANDEKPDRYCIFKARDGSLWYSKDKKLWRSDPNFTHAVPIDSSLMESYVTCLAEDTGGVYWISTLHSLLKWEKGQLHNVLKSYPPFMDHTIESIAEIAPQKLWIATRNGLYAFDKATQKIDPAPLLPNTYVRTIFKDREGGLWIGTYGSGYYSYWNGRFYPMPLDPQKYLATAHAFLEDRKGFLWISTNHGLFKVRRADLELTGRNQPMQPFLYYYDRSSGLTTNEFNGGCNPAALEDSTGHFYFPSMNGIVRFSPDSCHSELPDKPVYVDEFRVDSVPMEYRNNLTIPPDFDRIVVQISSPFYGARENLQVEYSLGHDSWYPVNPDGKIVINRLPFGKYSFEIRKKNGWGKNNYAAINIPFEVLRHWYNKPVYWVIAWIGFLWLVLLIRTRFLRSQNIRLQTKIDQRTFELEKSTLIRENLFSVIMHDLRSPMNAQNLLVEYLYKQHDKLNREDRDQVLFELLESNKNILRFTSDFLVWYDSQKDDFTVNKSPLFVRPFIEGILHFYQPITERKQLGLSFEADKDLTVMTDEHLLGIILRNIIDNAIKNTNTGGIYLRAHLRDGKVAISVRDTGKGMTLNEIDQLTSARPKRGEAVGQSFGYRLIREFSQLLGANLSISSQPGSGTVVTITLDA